MPKKSLGQHWLHDPAALVAMCETAEVSPNDTVLEIGPGLGTLTAELIKRADKVVAVEFDRQLADDLARTFKAVNLEIVTGDILRFDLTRLPAGYKTAANIPYYLTSKLLRVLCESSNPPSQMSLLVQKEVAERIVAGPGQMSLLSVSVQFYYQASLGRVVQAKLFTPPPKVDSQILKLVRHKQPIFPVLDTQAYFRLVKAGFSNRRKTLLNSLSAGLHVTKEQAGRRVEQAGLNPQSRPQELSLQDWYNLYLQLH